MNIQEYEATYGERVTSSANQDILRKLVEREVIQNVSMLVSHFSQNPGALDGSGYNYDDLMELFESRDYDEPAKDEGWVKYSDGFYMTADDQYYLSINLQERGEINVSVHKQEYPEQGTNGPEVWEFDSREFDCRGDEAGLRMTLDLTDPDELREHLIEIGVLSVLDELYDDERCDWVTSGTEDWQELCDDEGIEPHYEPIYEHWNITEWLQRKLDEKGEVTTDDFFGLAIWGRGCTGQAILLDGVIAEIAIDMEILTGMKNEGRELLCGK